LTDERQSHAAKEPPPEGFFRKWPAGFVAPQTTGGYAPSSRLAIQPFPEERHPQLFKTSCTAPFRSIGSYQLSKTE
jgi:hypothetical protein